MEVAQRYSIAWKGLKNGRHDFRFEVDKALFEAFESTEIKDGRCEVSVGVDRSEKQLTLDAGSRAMSSSNATDAWRTAVCPLISRGSWW